MTARVAAGCGCAPRTLSGSKSVVHHLNDELLLCAPLSIVALAPSWLTATRCPQLKQVVRRCPQLLAAVSGGIMSYQHPYHHHQHHHQQHLKYTILLLSPTLFGASCRILFFLLSSTLGGSCRIITIFFTFPHTVWGLLPYNHYFFTFPHTVWGLLPGFFLH